MASLKRILQKTWLAAFGLVSVAFIVTYFADDRENLVRILDADLTMLGFAVIAQFAYFFATVFTWQKALLYATDKTVPLKDSLFQVLMVNFGKYIPGKIWGLAARGKRLSDAGYNLVEISRASYLEQILLLLTGFGLMFFAAAIQTQVFAYWLAAIATLAGIVLVRYGSRIIDAAARLTPKARGFLQFFDVQITAVEIAKLSFGYVLIWLLLSSAFMFLCTSVVGIEVSLPNGVVFVLSLTAGFLAGFLALFAPGGAGVREGVGAALLTSIVELEDAVFLMLLFRVWVVVAELAAGAVVLLLAASSRTTAADRIGE